MKVTVKDFGLQKVTNKRGQLASWTWIF